MEMKGTPCEAVSRLGDLIVYYNRPVDLVPSLRFEHSSLFYKLFRSMTRICRRLQEGLKAIRDGQRVMVGYGKGTSRTDPSLRETGI